VVSGTLGFTNKAVRWSTALEYRTEDSSSLGDRKTWATRNVVTWQASEALLLFGKANLSVSNGAPIRWGSTRTITKSRSQRLIVPSGTTSSIC